MMIALKALIEVLTVGAVLYGLLHEDKVVAWEDRKIAEMKAWGHEFAVILRQYFRKKVGSR